MNVPDLRRDFVGVLLSPALSLLVLPLLGWAFSVYAAHTLDERLLAAIAANVDARPPRPLPPKSRVVTPARARGSTQR